MIANNFSTPPHGLLLLHLVVQHMHGTVPTGWHLFFCLCKTDHYWTVTAVRIWPQLPESRIPSNKIQKRTVFSWVLCCKTSTVQYQNMKQLSSCLHSNFSRAPHGLQFLHLVVPNTHGRVPTVWQLFSCKSVHFFAQNALRICTQLPESLCPSSKIQSWTVYI